MAETSDGISLHAREDAAFTGISFAFSKLDSPHRECSEVLDEETAFAGISFTFSKLGSPHRDLESLQVSLRIGYTVVRCDFDISGIRNPSFDDASSEGHFSSLLE